MKVLAMIGFDNQRMYEAWELAKDDNGDGSVQLMAQIGSALQALGYKINV